MFFFFSVKMTFGVVFSGASASLGWRSILLWYPFNGIDNTGQQIRKNFLLFLSHYRFLTNFDMGNTKMTSIFAHSIWILQKLSEIEAIFEARGKNLRIFKNSVCTFYCTQNDRLDPTVSMQKSVWKTDRSGPRYLRKTKMGLRFGLACHV